MNEILSPVFSSKNYFSALVLCCTLIACSKKDQNKASSGADFHQFSLVSESDNTEINTIKHRINIRVPDSISSGVNLKASFTLSPGATALVEGVSQQSGITLNNFERDLDYTVVSEDQYSRQEWTITATNNGNSIDWGLGHFLNLSRSNNRDYNWYIDQGTTGVYSSTNCGPSSVTMAIHWADSTFERTAAQARDEIPNDGGWWFTSDIDFYLNRFGVNHGIISLTDTAEKMASLITHELDQQEIIILCLDMDKVRSVSDEHYRMDKFYTTLPDWGHFIILKGYRKVDQALFFEAFDPYTFDLKNDDKTPKGMNRYYRFEDLAAACHSWWNYAFVIAKKGVPLSTEARSRILDPKIVPAAHNF